MIYKGLRKNIILIKNTDSKYFEEAYFILKDNYSQDESAYQDIISEANRIVERSVNITEKKRRPNKSILTFSFGASLCAFVYTLIIMFLR